MNELQELILSDIKSSTLTPEGYWDKYSGNTEIIRNYEEYSPQEGILEKIDNLLQEKDEILNIFVIGAIWCKDCKKHVPALLKIFENLDSDRTDLQILYGLKTDPLKKKEKYIWHERHSPPEATDPKFDAVASPIIYLFDKAGDYLGRIVEEPKEGSTLEADILEILENKFS